MDSKLNHTAIESYAKSFAKKLSQPFFENKEYITGYEILKFTTIKQLNLMVLKIIFKRWKQESARLQSPYFDYSHKEVKEALQQFMNTISQHIAIKREHFEPLLVQAVRDTLLLLCSPYDYYSKEINQREQSRISLEELKETQKYIKINPHLLELLIARFEKEKIDRAFNDEAFEMFNDVCEQTTKGPEDIEQYLEAFSKVMPISIDKIYTEVSPTTPKTAKLEQLIEQAASKTSINESLATEKTTVSEKLLKQKERSIQKNLTLNQRIMFVKELFAGNQESFGQAIQQLDNQTSYEQAAELVKKEWAKTHKWDMDSEEVIEFMEMLANRYA
jgi:hypothetical protein